MQGFSLSFFSNFLRPQRPDSSSSSLSFYFTSAKDSHHQSSDHSSFKVLAEMQNSRDTQNQGNLSLTLEPILSQQDQHQRTPRIHSGSLDKNPRPPPLTPSPTPALINTVAVTYAAWKHAPHPGMLPNLASACDLPFLTLSNCDFCRFSRASWPESWQLRLFWTFHQGSLSLVPQLDPLLWNSSIESSASWTWGLRFTHDQGLHTTAHRWPAVWQVDPYGRGCRWGPPQTSRALLLLDIDPNEPWHGRGHRALSVSSRTSSSLRHAGPGTPRHVLRNGP